MRLRITYIIISKQFRSERNQTIGSVLITIIRNRSVVGLRQDIPAVVISIAYFSVSVKVFFRYKSAYFVVCIFITLFTVCLRYNIPHTVISIGYLSVRNAVFNIIYSCTWYEL